MSVFGPESAAHLPMAGAIGLLFVLVAGGAEARDRPPEGPPDALSSEAPESDESDEAPESPEAAAPAKKEEEEHPLKLTFEGDNLSADLTISGVLNRAFIVWDDGGDQDVYFVDNAQDGTSLAIEGNAELGRGWTIGAVLGLDILYASSDEVDQTDATGFDNRVEVSDLYVSVGQERLGTLVIGYADTASDGIDNMNFADSDTLADADVINWNNRYFLRLSGGELSELRWEDFVDGTLAGDTRRIIGYTTPELAGLEASAAASEHYWDAALRYQHEWAETFELKAGLGAWKDTLSDSSEPVNDVGVGGSIALRHVPTGLNISFDAGTVSHTDNCEDPGEISGECPDRDAFYYVKGGIVRDFTKWGATSIYGELYQEKKRPHDSDPDLLGVLEQGEGTAQELKGSLATVLGVGVVQKVNRWNAEVYLGYRHYHLDVDLIDDAGPVADKGIDDFDAVMAGAAIRF
jgi:hypothetical protein